MILLIISVLVSVLLFGEQILSGVNGQDQCFGVNSGYDLSPGYNDLFNRLNIELGDCCTLCKATSDCKAFVWEKGTRTCFLKSDVGEKKADDRFIIGYASAVHNESNIGSSLDQCAAVNSGLDYSPGSNDIDGILATDLASCCNFCRETNACKAFVWSKGSGQCWLKDVDFPRVPSEDRISGLKELGPLVQGQQQCYGVNSGYDISPGLSDLLTRPRIQLGDCCALCKTTSECKAFVWNHENLDCHLKNEIGNLIRDGRFVVGYPEATPDMTGQCPSVYSGVDYSPGSHDIGTLSITNLAGCCDFCTKTAACKAFVWSRGSGECWLKDTDSPKVVNHDRISGLKSSSHSEVVKSSDIVCGSVAGLDFMEAKDYENAFANLRCHDFCAQGEAATCQCCKDTGSRGGKCVGGIPYCFR